MVEQRGERLVRRTVTSSRVLGHEVASTVVEEFVIEDYPEHIRKTLKRSSVPENLYPDALAVIGRAYGRVRENWTSEAVGDTPDLAWRVPAPLDFDSCVEQLRESVGVDDLIELSGKLFGRNNTPPEILMSMKNELGLIFNPPEEASR